VIEASSIIPVIVFGIDPIAMGSGGIKCFRKRGKEKDIRT
jgi:hypothetical protein